MSETDYNRRKAAASRAAGGLLLGALGLGAAPGPAAARQNSWLLPEVRPFELPLASPRATGMVGRVLQVSRGESGFGREREAEVGLGETLPLIALSRGRVPVTVHLGASVYARFSLEDASSAHISNDWTVGFTTHAELGSWDLAFEAFHESSHLGDEYSLRFSHPRIEWSRGILGLWVGRQLGPVQLRVNGSYAALDRQDLGPVTAAVAADYIGSRLEGLGTAFRPVLAVYMESVQSADWKQTWSARAGIQFGGGDERRRFGFYLTALSGLSTLRQFFGRRSRYAGVELRFDL